MLIITEIIIHFINQSTTNSIRRSLVGWGGWVTSSPLGFKSHQHACSLSQFLNHYVLKPRLVRMGFVLGYHL